MAYQRNPFLVQHSGIHISDQEFVKLFSPTILSQLPDNIFSPLVHVFRSPPGGGKTTLLRAFTPYVLSEFLKSKKIPDLNDSFIELKEMDVFDSEDRIRLIGVMLSCDSGYDNLPSGEDEAYIPLFRTLINCRIIFKTIRSLESIIEVNNRSGLSDVTITYDNPDDFRAIPTDLDALKLLSWSRGIEDEVYDQLDSLRVDANTKFPFHLTFEGVNWLSNVNFSIRGEKINLRPLLLLDDLHNLKDSQRNALLDEFIRLRAPIPIWLAERSIAIKHSILSKGARQGREVQEHKFEDIWGVKGNRAGNFPKFAKSVLAKRLNNNDVILSGNLEQYLSSEYSDSDYNNLLKDLYSKLKTKIDELGDTERYTSLKNDIDKLVEKNDLNSFREIIGFLIHVSRERKKMQLSFDLEELSVEELRSKDKANISVITELILRKNIGIPFYFGHEKLITMATNNIQEFLKLVAEVYDSIKAKVILRHNEFSLSAEEQEDVLLKAAKQRIDFIPGAHPDGNRVKRLIGSIGNFCRSKTYLSNAPYAPGVTGVRLSEQKIATLGESISSQPQQIKMLRRILSGCVAENLLVKRESSESSGRVSGTVFYLNRSLCAAFDLPLQYGGWQEVSIEVMIDWMEKGESLTKNDSFL